MTQDLSIEILRKMAKNVYFEVRDLIGTKEGAKRLQKGAGGDISMKIDILAENTIKKYLNDHHINILLISEEIGQKYIGDDEKIENNTDKLIVDPIDGSNNSSRGIPFYSVSIAYAKGERFDSIEKAVVLDLNTGNLFWAERGRGAYYENKKISVSENNISDRLIFEIDFYMWNFRRKLKKYSSILKKLYRIRVMGSAALSLCLLAKGSIDGYMNFKKGSRIVDYAAAFLILKEAGGEIFSINGEEINFNLDMELKVPLVASNAKISKILKEELKKINN
ncbi:MAG: inositol monophosphatase family protein [Candidatus Lokiarchaeota archaeon]